MTLTIDKTWWILLAVALGAVLLFIFTLQFQPAEPSLAERGIQQSISDSKLNHFVKDYLEENIITPISGGKVFCGFTGVKTVPDGQALHLYILTMSCTEYYDNHGQAVLASGTIGPIALDIQQHGDTYIVLSQSRPHDGNLYLQDYVKIFPPEFQFTKNTKMGDELERMTTQMDMAVNQEVQNYFKTASGADETVKVESPNAGENIKQGFVYEIKWSFSIPQTLTISLCNAEACTTIASDVPNSGTYSWGVSTVPGEDYHIEIYPSGARERVGRSEKFSIVATK